MTRILTPVEYIHDADLMVLPDYPVVDSCSVLLPVLRFAVVLGQIGHLVLRLAEIICVWLYVF